MGRVVLPPPSDRGAIVTGVELLATCPVPLPNFGPWMHDWRLWSRIWNDNGFLEQWYCTRCRVMDVRTVPETSAPASPRPQTVEAPPAASGGLGAGGKRPCPHRCEGNPCRRHGGHLGEHVAWTKDIVFNWWTPDEEPPR